MKAIALAASGLLFVQSSYIAPRPPEQFTGNRPEAITVYYAEPAVVDGVCRQLMAEANPAEQQPRDNWIIHACTAGRRSILPRSVPSSVHRRELRSRGLSREGPCERMGLGMRMRVCLPASKKANITMAQARAAVRRHLAAKPVAPPVQVEVRGIKFPFIPVAK